MDPQIVRQKIALESKLQGVLATATGLVFSGNALGALCAFDAGDLTKTLWTYNVGTAINGPAISFAFQGRQYLAVMAGGTAGAVEQSQRAGTKYFTASNYLFVFAL